MKALIWIGYLTVAQIVVKLSDAIVDLIPISNDTDIMLVALLGGTIYALIQSVAIWLAIRHCKKWDWYRIKKKSAKAGMTVSEYARYGLTEKFLEKLDTLCKSVPIPRVKPLLKELKKQKKITKDQYIIFLDEYYDKDIIQRDIYTDTHNDEPIVDIVSKTDTEFIPLKKHQKKESPVITKVSSFFLRYKKVFGVLTLVSSVLFIASLIAYNSLGTLMSKMADHYFETEVNIEWTKITEFGCGMISCPYCEGTVVRNYNYGRGLYSIGKYSRISDIRTMFESFCVVFALLAIVGLTALIINFVHHRKNSSNIDTNQDT